MTAPAVVAAPPAYPVPLLALVGRLGAPEIKRVVDGVDPWGETVTTWAWSGNDAHPPVGVQVSVGPHTSMIVVWNGQRRLQLIDDGKPDMAAVGPLLALAGLL